MKISSEILDDNRIRSKKGYMASYIFLDKYPLINKQTLIYILSDLQQVIEFNKTMWFEIVLNLTLHRL